MAFVNSNFLETNKKEQQYCRDIPNHRPLKPNDFFSIKDDLKEFYSNALVKGGFAT